MKKKKTHTHKPENIQTWNWKKETEREMINRISWRNDEYESWFQWAFLGWWNAKRQRLQWLLPNQAHPFWRRRHGCSLELLENGRSNPNLPLRTSLALRFVPLSMPLSAPKFCISTNTVYDTRTPTVLKYWYD